MPYLPDTTFRTTFLNRNGHFSTMYAGAFKKSIPPVYSREKWILPDGDFLEVDYQIKSAKKAIILCHGLEGSSTSSYNNRAARFYLSNGFSVFTWNNRSCGSVMNTSAKLYHHGEVEDLSFVVDEVIHRGFTEVFLVGFSMGGAQIMNYLGRKEISDKVKAGVAVSTPIELKSSAERMERGLSKIYLNRFIGKIRKKIIIKATEFPGLIDKKASMKISSFADLAEHYIVPVYRFESLDDFYKKASPSGCMKNIKTPVLILNSLDDPIIGEAGFPVDFARKHNYVHLETPRYGGHCAFCLANSDYAYSEIRALEFFDQL